MIENQRPSPPGNGPDISPEIRVGRYQLRREIGRGFSSVVYEAIDLRRGRTVALKVLTFLQHLSPARQRDLVERFMREARAISALSHPSIVAIYEIGQDEAGRQFIAMEHLEGETLRARLQREGSLPECEAVSYALQIAEALQYAHERGIIHRDIKPDNVFISPGGVAKLMDFGVAHIFSDEDLTQAGMVVGSPAYMSPEQISGLPLDGRTDVFSLGVMLAEMLTGRKPFDGDNIPAVMHQILNRPPQVDVVQTRALRAALGKALAKNRATRYASPAAFAAALSQVAAHLTGALPTSTVIMPMPAALIADAQTRARRASRLPALLAAALALLAAALLLWRLAPALSAHSRLRSTPTMARTVAPAALGRTGRTYQIARAWNRSRSSGQHRSLPAAPREPDLRIEEHPVTLKQSAPSDPSRMAADPVASPAPRPHGTQTVPAPIVKIADARQEQRSGKPPTPPVKAAAPADNTPRQSPLDTAVPPNEDASLPPAPPPDPNIPDSPPRVLRRTAPAYPDSALAASVEGVVRLRVQVNEDGDVTDATVLKSSGSTALDDAAVECARHWEYEPAFRGGQAVPGTAAERIAFRID